MISATHAQHGHVLSDGAQMHSSQNAVWQRAGDVGE